MGKTGATQVKYRCVLDYVTDKVVKEYDFVPTVGMFLEFVVEDEVGPTFGKVTMRVLRVQHVEAGNTFLIYGVKINGDPKWEVSE